jgi:MoxR-like ATPase
MLLNLGYPDAETEVSILYAQRETHPLDGLAPVLTRQDVLEMQHSVRSVSVEPSVAHYIVSIVDRTRHDPRLKLGVSPRGSLMLFRAAQAAAFAAGRDYVLPDDVQFLASYVLPHRVILTSQSKYGGNSKTEVVADIIGQVRVPT